MAISTLTNKYSATKNYNFELISENQTFKEVSINENFFLIDSIMMIKVYDYLSEIPTNISIGFSFIVKSGITGELSEYLNYIAVFSENNTWILIQPIEGMKCILNNNLIADYKSSAWTFSNLTTSSGISTSVDISSIISDNATTGLDKTYSIDKINSINNTTKSTIDSNTSRITTVENKVTDHTTSITQISSSLNSNSTNITKNTTDISENTKSITNINTSIATINNRISSIISDNATTGLDKTYSIDKINSINNTTKSTIDSNTSRITTVENKVTDLNGLIDDSLTSSAKNTYSVDKISSLIKTNSSRIDVVDTKIQTIINDNSTYSSTNTYSINKIISLLSSLPSGSGGTSYVGDFSVGDYKQSAKTSNHDNWLLCDGSEILISSYQSLYSIIGNNFGIATKGSTYFKLPDFRGRVFGLIGQGSGLTNRTFGESTGKENHTLTIDEMPKHSHQQNVSANSGSEAIRRDWSSDGLSQKYPQGISTESSGGGLPHNNMQPTLFGGSIFILGK